MMMMMMMNWFRRPLRGFSVNNLPTCLTVSLPCAECESTHNVNQAKEFNGECVSACVGRRCITEQFLCVKDRITIQANFTGHKCISI